MERRELIRALIDVGTVLASPLPLRHRIEALCEAVVNALGCDRSSVLLWHENHYRATYNFGNPPHIAERFKTYTVSPERSFIQELHRSDLPYLLINDAKSYPTTSVVAEAAGIAGIVLARITEPDGTELGMLSAEYTEKIEGFTDEMAEIVVGAAGLARGALMRDREIQRRVRVAEAMFEVEDLERRRLSREIHDDPLQRMLALRVGLESCRDRVSDQKVAADLSRLVEDCRDASTSLREVMNRTHPARTEQVDLDTTLRSLLAKRALDAKLWFSLEDQTTVAAPGHIASTFERVAEQAVSNVIQHASAQRLMLVLANRDDGTALTISDDGDGFDWGHVPTGRLGLVSMRERTELLHGTFTLQSKIGLGTQIEVWLPHTLRGSDSDAVS